MVAFYAPPGKTIMARISSRPPAPHPLEAPRSKKTNWSAASKNKGHASYSDDSGREDAKRKKLVGEQKKVPNAWAPKQTAKVRTQKQAAVDYKSAFVMADLTKTPAHMARLRMIDTLEVVHQNTPGGIFAPGKKPARGESHVSVVEIPVDEMPEKQRSKERPSKDAIRALRQMQRSQKAARLALDDNELEVFQGPRGPVKTFEVVSLKLRDPDNSLHQFRNTFQALGGTAMEKSADMHLTLAYLRIGTKLDEKVKKTLLQIAREANFAGHKGDEAGAAGWKQQEFYYSGRYSDKEFVRIKLADEAPQTA